ncbi:luc7-like protein 3 isoform X2 [Bicyclus anynana]|uniref:Luc7-like protein 3 isoform X2 n=1 Tax=Bicyclus anynana TaxID=110368 RepID=A0A6J1NHP2_BICAN|nr:luc7-like protein 3 isoform X2 [Bicyclus anynana]
MPREKSRYRDRRSSSYSSESSHERKKSKSKHRRRSRSTDRSESSSHRRRRSSSRSKHRRRSYSRSVSRERYEKPRKLNLDDTDIKIEKAIKAAEAAGLTMTKIPTYEYKDVEVKEEMPTIHDRNLIAELNSDSFVQKPFISSKSKKQSQNIIIDLNAETVSLPKAEVKVQNDDSIINFEEIPSHEELKEMWIKKLYQFRKKMLKDELQIN